MSLDANPSSPAPAAPEAAAAPNTASATHAGSATLAGSARESVQRERSYTWSDPAITAGAVATSSGMEILQGIQDGRFPPPPIMDTLQIYPVEVEAGRIVFEMIPQEWHYNPIGSVHGGVLSTLLDSALGCAVHTQLPAGTGYTTLEIKVNFVRPVTLATGAIRCEGTILSLGRRAATAEARVTTADGKLLAHATTTCMLFPVGE